MDVRRRRAAALIVVDTSVLIAIIFDEPERLDYLNRLLAERDAICPASVYVEAALKVERSSTVAHARALDPLLADLSLEIVPFTGSHAVTARAAFVRYGKGRSGLNFGDCMVYAVAKLADAPLLYKGQDFALTDIRSAL